MPYLALSPMNHHFLLPVVLTLGVSLPLAAAPLYEQTFNTESGLEWMNGATLGADATGVSGKAGDKAYVSDLTEKTEGEPCPAAGIGNGPGPVAESEITVTLWYKAREPMQDAATLFRAFCGQLMWEGRQKVWVMRLDAWPTGETLEKNLHWFYSGKPLALDQVGQWYFLAFTWKKEGNTGRFYIGDESGPAVEGRVMEKSDPLGDIAERQDERTIGNDASPAKLRPFDGSIDNLRVYSTVLDADALEKIRAADLQNVAPGI